MDRHGNGLRFPRVEKHLAPVEGDPLHILAQMARQLPFQQLLHGDAVPIAAGQQRMGLGHRLDARFVAGQEFGDVIDALGRAARDDRGQIEQVADPVLKLMGDGPLKPLRHDPFRHILCMLYQMGDFPIRIAHTTVQAGPVCLTHTAAFFLGYGDREGHLNQFVILPREDSVEGFLEHLLPLGCLGKGVEDIHAEDVLGFAVYRLQIGFICRGDMQVSVQNQTGCRQTHEKIVEIRLIVRHSMCYPGNSYATLL